MAQGLKLSEIEFVKKTEVGNSKKLARSFSEVGENRTCVRYSVSELRLLNDGRKAACGVWPEEELFDVESNTDFVANNNSISSPPDTPLADETVWSVSNTPFTAPARMHASFANPNAAPPMTPMRAKTPSTKVKTQETDKRRLGQRAKQVMYGKSTLGYRLCRILSATDEDVRKKKKKKKTYQKSCSFKKSFQKGPQ